MAIPKVKGKESRKILYIGSDNSYWAAITERYQMNYANSNFEYPILYDKKANYQQLFLKVLEIKPVIIYIDLTTDMDFNMRLAQFIARDNFTKNVPLVGLVEKKEILAECIYIGMDFIHVKCGEYHDVVFDPMRKAFPKEVKIPQFARAKFNRDAVLIDDFRIGYVSATGIRIEGNTHLEEGSVVEIQNQIPVGIIPSKKYFVKKVYTSNLYYDYAYAYELDFQFVDPPELEEDEPVAQKNQKDQKDQKDDHLKKLKSQDLSKKQQLANYEEEVNVSKKRIKQWVKANMVDQAQKKTRIMVVDKDLNILKNSTKPLDQYSFVIRCQSILSEKMEELDRLRPNIIAFNIDEFRENEHNDLTDQKRDELKEKEAASLNVLSTIIQFSKTLDKYNPFIILFNCTKFTSKSFQDSFKYPLLLTNKEVISLELLLSLAQMYEDKQEKKTNELIQSKLMALRKENPQKYGKLTAGDFQEQKYFLSKKNPMSTGSITYPIKIIEMTESEMTISSETLLQMAVYRLTNPTEMSITIIPEKDSGKLYSENKTEKIYQALIHSVGENDKKKLRQFVNEFFFSDINAKRSQEADAYKQLHQQALQKKIGSGESQKPNEKPKSSGDEE